MKNKNITLLVILIIVFVIGIIIFMSYYFNKPAEISLSHDTCLTEYCLIGQQIKLNIRIDPKKELKNTDIKIESEFFSKTIEKELINSVTNIPLEFYLTGDLKNNKKYDFNIFLRDEKTWKRDSTKKIKVPVRYPEIELKYEDLDNFNKKDLKRIDLKLNNREEKNMTCKFRIITSYGIILEHPNIKEINKTENITTYESQFENIGPKLDTSCCNTIKFKPRTEAGESQIKIIPIYKIDGNEIILKEEMKDVDWTHNSKKLD